MRRVVPAVALIAVLASGCALFGRDAARALADADTRAAKGDYPASLVAYDAYLARYPDDEAVPRVRAVRAIMGELVALRAEVAVLRERRDAEAARLRQELSARQAELTRLREDLEALKRTDLQMERRRR
jgi:hypothetical protein